jgi:hypothetical protein
MKKFCLSLAALVTAYLMYRHFDGEQVAFIFGVAFGLCIGVVVGIVFVQLKNATERDAEIVDATVQARLIESS